MVILRLLWFLWNLFVSESIKFFNRCKIWYLFLIIFIDNLFIKCLLSVYKCNFCCNKVLFDFDNIYKAEVFFDVKSEFLYVDDKF